MRRDYDDIYIAPHPDDVVFSCAGSIARRIERGQRVLVVTVCTAIPPPGTPSAFAASLHHRWGLSDAEVVAVRLDEDRRALTRLGVDAVRLGQLDAIYRRPDAYDRQARLFGRLAADDPLPVELGRALAGLCARLPGAALWAPLAVAGHVDHQAVHLVARELERRGRRVTYYEDLPYAVEPGAVERRLLALDVRDRAIAHCEDVESVLATKVAAMRCYASQVYDLPALPDEAVGYARHLAAGAGAVERSWALPPRRR
jgi:LmbE family N-acetylglucosaminyl deacetylase